MPEDWNAIAAEVCGAEVGGRRESERRISVHAQARCHCGNPLEDHAPSADRALRARGHSRRHLRAQARRYRRCATARPGSVVILEVPHNSEAAAATSAACLGLVG